MSPIKLLMGAAGLLYLAGFLVCFLSFAYARVHRFIWGEACMGAGFAFHLAACLGSPPFAMNLPHVLSLLAFTLLAFYFILRLLRRGKGLWLPAFPIIFALSVVVLALPSGSSPSPALPHTFFLIHITLALLGISGIFFGILYSILYLIQEKALKEKRWGSTSSIAPSLAKADSFALHSLWGGFILYTLGVLMGMLWSYRVKGVPTSLSQKELGALIAWGIFAFLLHVRVRYGWRGRKALMLYGLGIFSILAALGGIRVF
jgi:ABC-type uncharacterized transport system permease subunit